MCEALDYAEKHQKPEIEGELKDVPVLQVDDDWEQKQKKKQALDSKLIAKIESKKNKVKSLFDTFKL